MSILRLLFGRPLASHEEGEQRVGAVAGIPMLGLDSLSSAAYGPEAAMTLLLLLGAAGIEYIGPINAVVIVLLLVVYFFVPSDDRVDAPFRHVFNPLLDYLLDTKKQHPDRQVAVLIPELVARRWYHHLLHNERAALLKALLLVRGDEDIVVINVPWYLDA